MKIIKKISSLNIAITFIIFSTGCTKYEKGFISPTMSYAVDSFTLQKGIASNFYSIQTDGSSYPTKIKWLHVYDSLGYVVDSLFAKKYPISIWTAAYSLKEDTTYGQIIAKQAVENLMPIEINESNGSVQANSGTFNLPVGVYKMDIQATNVAGTVTFKKIITLRLLDAKPILTSPEQANYATGVLVANTGTLANVGNGGYLYNNTNNPFVEEKIERLADTPNTFIMKIVDRNGVLFKHGELAKRPWPGLNPPLPYYPNFESYVTDTYKEPDTATFVCQYPITPFPISFVNGLLNMYNSISGKYVLLDSTLPWSSNQAGNYYKGVSDPHFLGYFDPKKNDMFMRYPIKIQVPGTYRMTLKLLNTTHR